VHLGAIVCLRGNFLFRGGRFRIERKGVVAKSDSRYGSSVHGVSGRPQWNGPGFAGGTGWYVDISYYVSIDGFQKIVLYCHQTLLPHNQMFLGHPVIRRAIEIIIDLFLSLGKGNAAASTIMAIEEFYNEPAPLNATRLASKGVYFLSISPPEDTTTENSNGPESVNENPMPNSIVAKAKPKQSAAKAEQRAADFEPDIDEESLTPNVTMIRTMLVNGRDDDGNEFPPPMTDLCHAHPVEGSDHDYVKALREATIHTTGSLNSTTVKIAPWNHYGKDKHFAEKTDSLIEVPAPRLMCLVYTVRESHNDKIDAIRNTWAGGCDGFLVFSTTTDLTIPAIAIRHKGPEVYENMWQKVRSIWKYVGERHLMEEYEWFHLGGDDMFIIPNNLKTYLASLAYTHGSPRTTPYFVGRRFKDLSHNHFNTGGPGYTMSQATLRKLLHNIEADQCSPNLKTPKEDVTISQCLTSLGVHLTDTRDAKGRERYHHFDPGWMMDYTPRKRDVGSQIPQESDWYELYNREWGMLFGADCCAPDSVSFHYVPAGAIRHMHALLHQCQSNEAFSRSTIEAKAQTQTYCRWEPVQQSNTTALFRGDASRYRTKCNSIDEEGVSRSASIYTERVEVVISYCRPGTGFDWIYYDILLQVPKGWNVVLTFISRCSGEKSIPDFREYANIDKVNVITIGNSGGQEYSYAKFINEFMKNPSPAVILFAKERKPIDFNWNNLGGYRNTSEMIDIASNYEFGCGIKPGPKHSWYHDKQTLHGVFLKEWKQPAKAAKSIFNTEKYEHLQDFHHRALNYSFPPPKYTPVCYGGSFAIHSQKIVNFFRSDGSKGKGVMERLEHTLSRSGQAIIEELFVERSWAGFFSEPLSAVQESKLASDIKEIVPSSKPTAGQIKIMF